MSEPARPRASLKAIIASCLGIAMATSPSTHIFDAALVYNPGSPRSESSMCMAGEIELVAKLLNLRQPDRSG